MASSCRIIGLVLCCLVVSSNANKKEIGERCIVTRTGEEGICELLLGCTAARNDLVYHQRLPTECGYRGMDQIVCCPIKVEILDSVEPDNLPIAVRKCKEYSEHVFVNVTLIANDVIMFKRIDRCGNSVIPLIVGGSPAAEKEFPHSALLGYEQPDRQIIWKCGGSLVSTRYVLTAAHCLKTETYGKVTHVRLGELVISGTNKMNVIDVAIDRRIKHPEYRKSKKYNDIALLKLARKIKLSPHIRPICLPTENLQPNKSIATGWGTVKFAGDYNDALLKVTLESYSNEECSVLFQNVQDIKLRKGIIETQLCAGWKNRNETRDTCQGDSGGPLQIYSSNLYCMYTQVAVTSFGIGCNSTQLPGIYTRLYNYVQWVQDTIWAPGEDD